MSAQTASLHPKLPDTPPLVCLHPLLCVCRVASCGLGIASSNGTDVSTPGNIQLEHCTAVSFRGCSFTHLGAIGIDISKGSHDCIIDDCFFEDISAAGVQIGGYKNALATNPAEQDLGNAVTNSVLQWCAIEYAGHVGLIVGYAANTVISHNRISNLTYGGGERRMGVDNIRIHVCNEQYYQPQRYRALQEPAPRWWWYIHARAAKQLPDF